MTLIRKESPDDVDKDIKTPNTKLRITLISLFIIYATAYALPQTEGSKSSEVRDPMLTAKMLEDLPFVKPEVTLQHALKLAETSLKKKVDLRLYFLQEAKLSYSKNDVIEPYWYFKWVRWGVKQSANIPLEITVSMKGKVSPVRPIGK